MIPAIRRRHAISKTIEQAQGLSALLQRVFRNRGIEHASELSLALTDLYPPTALDGARQAAGILAEALIQGRRILILGDFDADGATSCALSILALRGMGFSRVDYLVPNRFDYGYGLTPEIVALAARRGAELIVTVDNGIASIEGVASANARGIPVIVTDHHLPGSELPAAAVIVNPNHPDNGFPGKATAGVGVIFYVLLALRAELRDRGWFEQQRIREPNMADYLDLVALGTVADVVPLDRNNRILVHQGLARIRAGRCRPGITALLRVAGRDPARVSSRDLGFAVGPRLNAAGRLDDISLGIECLLADGEDAATELAGKLQQMNQQRREIEASMQTRAMQILAEMEIDRDERLPWGLCLFDPAWHQGVIGILASRIKEVHHRPVIVFAEADAGQLKGSARSIAGLHIRDLLDELATANPGLLHKFGGHAMAAGLSLSRQHFDRFREVFDRLVRRKLEEDDLNPLVFSDGPLDPREFSLDTARRIADAAPWGAAFPEPVFDGWFQVLQQRVLQDKHWKLVVQPDSAELAVDAIGFHLLRDHPAPLPDRVRLAYRLDINRFRGSDSLQLHICSIEIGT